MAVYETWGQLEHEIPSGKAAFYVNLYFSVLHLDRAVSETGFRGLLPGQMLCHLSTGVPERKNGIFGKEETSHAFLSPWAFSVCATKSKKNRCLVSRTSRTNIEPRKLVSGGRRRYYHVEVV